MTMRPRRLDGNSQKNAGTSLLSVGGLKQVEVRRYTDEVLCTGTLYISGPDAVLWTDPGDDGVDDGTLGRGVSVP